MKFTLSFVLAALAAATPVLADSTTTSNPSTSHKPIVTSASYRIAEADELDIAVANEPDMDRHVSVLPDGTISYPGLGQVRAIGLTLSELRSKLTAGLAHQIILPEVTISVSHRAERLVSVLGAVRAQGKVSLAADWRVLDLLAAVGGLTVDKPDWATATLIRGGGSQAVPLDLVRIMNGTATGEENPVVQPGDILLVTEREKSTHQVRVLGEVKQPGFLPIPEDGSLLAALLAAGGTTDDAALGSATIQRGSETIPVDLRPLGHPGANPSAEPHLQPGDTLYVPRNERKCAVLGAVVRPGIVLLPEQGDLDLMEVLSLVGGGNSNADMQKVSILRNGMDVVGSSPSKSPEIITVDVYKRFNESDHGAKGAPAPPVYRLAPGDVVFVPDKKDGHGWDIRQAISFLPLLSLVRR